MKLYYSPELKDLLSNMDNEIANFLISLDNTYVYDIDMNLIDIDKTNLGLLTFSKNSNIKNVYMDNYTYFTKPSIWKESRNSIRIGKFIQKFKKFSNSEIETFSNLFKSLVEVSSESFELVSGDEIKKWYLESNYYITNGGTLHGSCMRSEECQEFLDIYTKNPNTCKLLILKKNNKLIARALVWKVHEIKVVDFTDGFYFSKKKIESRKQTKQLLSGIEYVMDRCYFTSDHYKYSMEEYAKKNNWAIRHNDCVYRIYNTLEKTYKSLYLKIKVKTNKLEFDKYPYMDTFARYNSKKGILYSDRNEIELGHILTTTYGSYKQSKTKWEYIKYYLFD